MEIREYDLYSNRGIVSHEMTEKEREEYYASIRQELWSKALKEGRPVRIRRKAETNNKA